MSGLANRNYRMLHTYVVGCNVVLLSEVMTSCCNFWAYGLMTKFEESS